MPFARLKPSFTLPSLSLDYQNDFERQFCAQRLDQYLNSVARVLAIISIAFLALSLLAERFVVAPADFDFFFAANVGFLSLHALWWAALRRTRLTQRQFLWSLQSLYIVFMGMILWRTVDRGGPSDIILASNGLVVISAVMLLMCPFAHWLLPVTAVLYAVIGGVAFAAHPLLPRWIGIDVTVLAVMTTAQMYHGYRMKSQALREYRTMLQVAPRLVVQQALTSESTLVAAFNPQMRPVACVSSDWRDYQRFSQTQNPDVVAAALASYYTLCNKLLDEVAPQGNYYSDWIADELFVVFYGRWGGTSRDLVAQAVNFAKALLEAKPAFLTENKMPQAIDFGISAGAAYVGMMGPQDHSKATALGETPGISRRLQATGKLLRQRLGECDRIIVDANVFAWLKRKEAFSEYVLQAGERVRDLDVTAPLYFLAAGAQKSEHGPDELSESA